MKPQNDRKDYTKWIIGVAACCILIYLGIQNIGVLANAVSWCFKLFSPLLLGLAFALIVNVPMLFIEDHLFAKTTNPRVQALRRPLAIVLALLLILGILACVFGLIVPALINAVKILAENIPGFINNSVSKLENLPFGQYILSMDWQKPLNALQSYLENQGVDLMNSAVAKIGSAVGVLINLFVALIFSVYVLFNKNKLKAQTQKLIHVWLPRTFGNRLIYTASVASGVFRNFVAGQTLESVILGVLCVIGMLILQIPYAPIIAALISVTALVPIAGPIAGTIVGALMILTVSPIKAIIFVVFMLVLQQVEGNVIYPKVMGSTVNLPAMWVLAAVTIGGSLAGPVGMLLGVPAASTIYILVKQATKTREANAAAATVSQE